MQDKIRKRLYGKVRNSQANARHTAPHLQTIEVLHPSDTDSVCLSVCLSVGVVE